MGTFQYFHAIFFKGKKLSDFLFASLDHEAVTVWGIL